jgi:HSP20 family molecular chaperone IbpA
VLVDAPDVLNDAQNIAIFDLTGWEPPDGRSGVPQGPRARSAEVWAVRRPDHAPFKLARGRTQNRFHFCWSSASKSLREDFVMSRVPSLSSPFLLGFDEIERALDRVVKGADGYPPYNIERCDRANGQPERLRITLAVAGFTRDQLDVTIEENQLVIRGRQQDDKARQYIHRGIAARHFQRTFVLAEGMLVLGADLKNGLLSIDLARPEPERVVKTIAINEHE